MSDYKTIAESKNFIVLDQYTPEWKVAENYQSESDLEREFIQDLQNQGYEVLPGLNTPDALLANVRAMERYRQAFHVETFDESKLLVFGHLFEDVCKPFVVHRGGELGQGGADFLDKEVDHDTGSRRQVAAGGIDDAERQRLRRIVRQQFDQAAGADVVHHESVGQHGDTAARDGGAHPARDHGERVHQVRVLLRRAGDEVDARHR